MLRSPESEEEKETTDTSSLRKVQLNNSSAQNSDHSYSITPKKRKAEKLEEQHEMDFSVPITIDSSVPKSMRYKIEGISAENGVDDETSADFSGGSSTHSENLADKIDLYLQQNKKKEQEAEIRSKQATVQEEEESEEGSATEESEEGTSTGESKERSATDKSGKVVDSRTCTEGYTNIFAFKSKNKIADADSIGSVVSNTLRLIGEKRKELREKKAEYFAKMKLDGYRGKIHKLEKLDAYREKIHKEKKIAAGCDEKFYVGEKKADEDKEKAGLPEKYEVIRKGITQPDLKKRLAFIEQKMKGNVETATKLKRILHEGYEKDIAKRWKNKEYFIKKECMEMKEKENEITEKIEKLKREQDSFFQDHVNHWKDKSLFELRESLNSKMIRMTSKFIVGRPPSVKEFFVALGWMDLKKEKKDNKRRKLFSNLNIGADKGNSQEKEDNHRRKLFSNLNIGADKGNSQVLVLRDAVKEFRTRMLHEKRLSSDQKTQFRKDYWKIRKALTSKASWKKKKKCLFSLERLAWKYLRKEIPFDPVFVSKENMQNFRKTYWRTRKVLITKCMGAKSKREEMQEKNNLESKKRKNLRLLQISFFKLNHDNMDPDLKRLMDEKFNSMVEARDLRLREIELEERKKKRQQWDMEQLSKKLCELIQDYNYWYDILGKKKDQLDRKALEMSLRIIRVEHHLCKMKLVKLKLRSENNSYWDDDFCDAIFWKNELLEKCKKSFNSGNYDPETYRKLLEAYEEAEKCVEINVGSLSTLSSQGMSNIQQVLEHNTMKTKVGQSSNGKQNLSKICPIERAQFHPKNDEKGQSLINSRFSRGESFDEGCSTSEDINEQFFNVHNIRQTLIQRMTREIREVDRKIELMKEKYSHERYLKGMRERNKELHELFTKREKLQDEYKKLCKDHQTLTDPKYQKSQLSIVSEEIKAVPSNVHKQALIHDFLKKLERWFQFYRAAWFKFYKELREQTKRLKENETIRNKMNDKEIKKPTASETQTITPIVTRKSEIFVQFLPCFNFNSQIISSTDESKITLSLELYGMMIRIDKNIHTVFTYDNVNLVRVLMDQKKGQYPHQSSFISVKALSSQHAPFVATLVPKTVEIAACNQLKDEHQMIVSFLVVDVPNDFCNHLKERFKDKLIQKTRHELVDCEFVKKCLSSSSVEKGEAELTNSKPNKSVNVSQKHDSVPIIEVKEKVPCTHSKADISAPDVEQKDSHSTIQLKEKVFWSFN